MELNKVVRVPLKPPVLLYCVINFLDSLSPDTILDAGRWSAKSGDWEGANNEQWSAKSGDWEGANNEQCGKSKHRVTFACLRCLSLSLSMGISEAKTTAE